MPSKFFHKRRKAQTYWPVRWTFSSALARTKLPQVISLVPLLGYAVLWSDDFHAQIMRFQSLEPALWLSPIDRIKCLYFGSVLVLIGVVLLYLFCPAQIRTFGKSTEYADQTFKSLDSFELESVYSALSPHISSDGAELLPPFLGSVDAKHLANGLHLISNEEHRRGTLQSRGDRQTWATAALQAYYLKLDRAYPVVALATFVLMVSGAVLFLLPSIELFLMVVKQTFAFPGAGA